VRNAREQTRGRAPQNVTRSIMRGTSNATKSATQTRNQAAQWRVAAATKQHPIYPRKEQTYVNNNKENAKREQEQGNEQGTNANSNAIRNASGKQQQTASNNQYHDI